MTLDKERTLLIQIPRSLLRGFFIKRELQKQTYHELRAQFQISAQVAIRCIAKVCDAYRTAFELHRQRIQETGWINERRAEKGQELIPLPEMKPCQFRNTGSLPFDDRILTYQEGCVSIWTVVGRIKVSFVCGEPQKQLLHSRQGESDLVFRKGKWFVLATCHQNVPLPETPQGVIGVDMGLENIATTSDGKNYSGEKVKALRRKLREHRRRLQKCGTKSAKRRLKKLSKRQERFIRDTNHCLAKEIVRDARASHKALSLEDLTGIRKRTGLNKEMRWLLGNWTFAQLRACIEYKARLAGVWVFSVDPRNTSRTCSRCGYCAKANRKKTHFQCLECGFEDAADANASRNIALRGDTLRATVNWPIVSSLAA